VTKQGSNIKQAYEIYSTLVAGYNKRQVHGYSWNKEDAAKIARDRPGCFIGSIHLAKVNGRWHRISVLPTENISGNPDEAQDSRISDDNLPIRNTPGMFIQVDNKSPVRLGLDIEKSINLLATVTGSSVRLFTLRRGGPSPISFKPADLLHSDALQERVYFWLKNEISHRRTNRGLA
jgi:hypothetical protein